MADKDADLMNLTWPSSADHYEVKMELGHGASAVVVSAVCKDLNVPVAIKIMDLDSTTAELEDIQQEMVVMRGCRHPNLVNYYTSFVQNRNLWVVMRLLDKGSISDVISYKSRRTRNGVLDETAIATILKSVLEGLNYLHQQGQIHRDVKAGNILVNSSGVVQLADFGVSTWLAENQFAARENAEAKAKSKKMKQSQAARKTFVGTPCWMAPEVMEQKGYDEKADIWSIGITALELATGAAPYAHCDPMRVLLLTIGNDPPTLETCGQVLGQDFSAYKKTFRKFVADCLQKDPLKRPSAAELLKSEFIKKYAKDEQYLAKNVLEDLPNAGRRSVTDNALLNTTPVAQSSSGDGWDFGTDDQPAAAAAAPAAPAGPVSIPLRLRVRDLSNPNAITDISFNMQSPPDTPATIAEELVSSNLIRQVDAPIVEKALAELISRGKTGCKTFPLSGTEAPSGFDMSALHDALPLGFAQVHTGAATAPAPAPASPEKEVVV